MEEKNYKSIKVTLWLCICYCILSLCYTMYGIFFRDHVISIIILTIVGETIVIGFVLLFVLRILRGLKKSGQVFIPNNHRLLIYAAVCLFVQSYIAGYTKIYLRYINGYELDWLQIILNPILKPDSMAYIISGLMLLIIAYLYKFGTQAVEDQRLTI